MADCKINPSFLRGFDFKLLYAVPSTDAYRAMSLNNLTGEIIVPPYGHTNFLRSTDWGYTFAPIEVTGMSTTATVAYDTAFGMNRHAIAFASYSDLTTGAYANTHDLAILPTGTTEGTHQAVSSGTSPAMTGGVTYGNGAFYNTIMGVSAPASGGVRWFDDIFTNYSITNVSAAPWMAMRWGRAQGQWVYGVYYKVVTSNVLGAVGIGRRPYPPTSYILPAGEHVAYFVDEATYPEVSDFIDYDGVTTGGAAFIERNGTIWRNTAANFQTWVKGATPPESLGGFTFPHLTEGHGLFGETVLLSLDSSGSKGLLSLDHGATHTYFDLPAEIAQTLPGGSVVPTGQTDMRFPRVYDLKYVPDPNTNFAKGRWILCGGLAIWELVPYYAA